MEPNEANKLSFNLFPSNWMPDGEITVVLLNFCGRTHVGHSSFSQYLLESSNAFQEYAKLSCHTPIIKKWFEKVISGKQESNFSTVCESIHQKLRSQDSNDRK